MNGTTKDYRRRGFTVIEVIMVVLLLAAVLSLVIINFFSFDGALGRRPAIDQIHRAVAEAHRIARTERVAVNLFYDEEIETLVLTDASGAELTRYDLPEGTEAELAFIRVKPEEEMAEEPSYEVEDEPIELVTFNSYGASAPFVIEFAVSDEARVLQFDPFSAISWNNEDVF